MTVLPAPIHELESGQFRRVVPLFEGRKEYVPVLAVLAGNFPGRVFVDDRTEPRTALVWALTRWAYIDGDPTNEAFNAALAGLITDEIFPASLQLGSPWFELYASDSPSWSIGIEQSLQTLGPERHLESTYLLDENLYHQRRTEQSRPPGMEIRFREIPIVPERTAGKSQILSRFPSKTAFGYELVGDRGVAAVCRSNGFAHESEFMIDVETTSAAQRGRGYATLVATALIDHALSNGLTPLWETTEDNIPSQRLAGKLGFSPVETYPVYAMKIP